MVSSGAVGSCTVYNLDTSRASFSSVGKPGSWMLALLMSAHGSWQHSLF